MMNNLLKTFAFAALALPLSAPLQAEDTTIRVFDEAVFYDGYLLRNIPEDAPTDDGILRNFTYLYSVKLSDEQLNKIGQNLHMNVYIKAFCDNYDRIGNINLALVPKGSEKYCVNHQEQSQDNLPEAWQGLPEADSRIELGRFITPFMDKNKQPDTVPYTYVVDYLSYIFRDASLREKYDYWIEFELFGVPYAAQSQISGCSGCNSVFYGTLDFVTNSDPLPLTDQDVFVPIVIKRPEYKGGNLNSYNATDIEGRCQKTYTFEVPDDCEDAQILLITSKHGANSGGEEYIRRKHYVYFDDELALYYVPGRTSCEPFRQYNTQLNGIYGYYEMTDDEWQSFSNWCPGDVIDNNIISLGAVAAGTHKITINVKNATFKDNQGDIPVSIFFQGLKNGKITGLTPIKPDIKSSITIWGGNCIVSTQAPVASLELYDIQGNLLRTIPAATTFSVASLPKGIYLLSVQTTDGLVETHKFRL